MPERASARVDACIESKLRTMKDIGSDEKAYYPQLINDVKLNFR